MINDAPTEILGDVQVEIQRQSVGGSLKMHKFEPLESIPTIATDSVLFGGLLRRYYMYTILIAVTRAIDVGLGL
jgi:hypothetical protein